MGMMNEFKEFAAKGNVVDMAVGFILGGAFSTIVKSLVNDVIMPPIGLLLGGVDFSNLKLTLKDAVLAEDGTVTTEAVAISYGLFINNVISFLIVALALFFLIKGINSLKRKQEEEVETPEPEPEVVPADVQLLGEIRDLLAKK